MIPVWVDLAARGYTLLALGGVAGIFCAIGWRDFIGLEDFFVECVDHGEFDDEDGCPECDDDVDLTEDPNATDHAYDMLMDEAMGVHP